MPPSATLMRFESACGEIGTGLAELGFRYLKSKRQAKKVVDEWTQIVWFQSSHMNTPDDVRLWVWYWIDSDEVSRWRRERDVTPASARVFGCGLGYLGDPATFVGWNVAGDSAPIVRDVIDRVRSGTDRISSAIMDVPTFLDRVSESDLTFFNPADVVDLLAAHRCGDQIGPYLRRLSGGLQSTGTVRNNGSLVGTARRYLSGEEWLRNNLGAADLLDALNRAESSHLLTQPLPGPDHGS